MGAPRRDPTTREGHDHDLGYPERPLTHFAFIAPPLPGHFNPLTALAGELIRRGHRATFVNQPDAASLVRPKDIRFEAIGAGSHPPGSLEKRVAAMGRLSGPFGLRGMIGEVARFTDMVCREAPAALGRIGAEAVISDQMEAGGGLAAEHLGLPFISAATALPINREEQVPPPYVPCPSIPATAAAGAIAAAIACPTG